MIEIEEIELEGPVSETPVFEVKGNYDGEEFHCRIELRFEELDLEDVDYEHLDGVDLGPTGLDALEELVNEILETEEYSDASDDFQREQSDSDTLFD